MSQAGNKLVASFLLLAGLAHGQAGGVITGSVRDPQQAAIPEAQVRLVARVNTVSLTVTADKQGQYRIEQIVPGTYLLNAAAKGFANSGMRAVQIEKEAEVTLDFLLQVAGFETTVVVTASTTPQTTDELSKAVSVVDGQTIDLRGQSFVAEALDGVPGLRVQRLGGPGSFTSIKTRGLRNEDTAVLIDGFRLRDAAAPQGDASSLLEDVAVTNIDRVEVLRGAGSSLYGTSAAGGVVNIITGEGGGRTQGLLLAEGGALGIFRGRALFSGALKGNRSHYSFGVTHLNVMSGVGGDDPARNTSGQGRLDYSISPKVRMFGRMFAADAFGKIRSSPQGAGNAPSSGIIDSIPLAPFKMWEYESGTPLTQLDIGTASFIPAAANPDFTRAARTFSGAVSLSTRPRESLGLTADYQYLRTRRRFGDGPAGAGWQPAGSSVSFYDGDVQTASVRIDWKFGAHNSIDAGYEFELETYGSHSVEPNPADNWAVGVSQRSHAVYAQDQVRLLGGRLQFGASYRAQFFALDRPTFTPESSVPCASQAFPPPPTAQTADGSAAWFFRATGTKIRTHVGRGYRAPSLYERFGAFYSSFGYSVYGDPRLRPERSIAVDGGIDQALWNSRARLSATYFYTRLQKVIVFDVSGAITPALDPFGRFIGYRNMNGGLARGVELSAALAPTRSLTLNTAYTYTNARERTPLVDGVLRTYAIPDHQFSLSAVERVSARLSLLFDLRSLSNYLAPIFNPLTFASRAYRFPGMRLAQLGASYRLPLDQFRALRFYARADNVFNQTYFESGFPMAGATALGGIQFEF
jgi:outer membrane cobalamin receptor